MTRFTGRPGSIQYSVWGVGLPSSLGAYADAARASAGPDGVTGWNERGRGKAGRRVWLSLFTLYRVTTFVTHGLWEAARAAKGGPARLLLENAQDFGDFLGEMGGINFSGGVGFEVRAMCR